MTDPPRRESEETGRVLALSDGVIAIVITLLVLDITVPTLTSDSSASMAAELVVEQWPDLFGFSLSFLVVGLYWMLHRRTFVHIERHERGVVFLNLLFLLVVAFVPYATSVFTTYPGRFGVQFLSGVLAVTGFSLALLWVYASRNDLVEEGLTSLAVQIQAVKFLASPLVFLGAIVLAVFDARLAILTWTLLVPINAALQSRLAESLEEAARTAQRR